MYFNYTSILKYNNFTLLKPYIIFTRNLSSITIRCDLGQTVLYSGKILERTFQEEIVLIPLIALLE